MQIQNFTTILTKWGAPWIYYKIHDLDLENEHQVEIFGPYAIHKWGNEPHYA